ncbi:MAG: hypothetical protein KDD43_05350 [Bdellovibrionales bacterium]|nr:hypothetical protein [Bdellovibrionales bacterium]
MAEVSKQDIVERQRQFLHDLSSQLMIAMGMVETTQIIMTREARTDEATRLGKAQVALGKMSDMLKTHRQEIKVLMEELKNSQ